MTAVTFSPRGMGDTTDTEPIFTGGFYKIRLSTTQTSGQWVLPAWSMPRQLSGALVTENLDPNATIPYELLMYVPNGGVTVGKIGGMLEIHEFRFVVGSGPVAWESLTQVSGPSGEAVLTSAEIARITALEAQLSGFTGGGATNLAGITNMSADARALLVTPNSFSTMRGLLSAAPTVSPVFTTALTAANPTFTGTVTIPDNALAIADTSGLQTALDAKAPLASPVFTGNPTAPTPTAGDNDTSIATTAFVATAVSGVSGGGGAPLVSPNFSGTPTAPTAAAGTSTTQIATTAFATTALTLKAPINDPTFTGSVTLPDPIDPTDAATKNYVDASMAAASPREGNVVAIFGAASARVHPSTGLALDPDTVVMWLTDGTAATNAINGDITLNRATI